MAEGSVFKRCTCRDEQRRKLGPHCPELRRRNVVGGRFGAVGQSGSR